MKPKKLWVLSSIVVFGTLFLLSDDTLTGVKRALEVGAIIHLMLEAIRNFRQE